MRLLLRITLLTAAFTAGTVSFGWLSVPALGGVWGGTANETTRPGLVAGLSAGLAWGALLLWTNYSGPLPLLASRIGTITGLPPAAWFAATVLFPLALAWSGALVVCTVRARLGRMGG